MSRISNLPGTAFPSLEHRIAASKDGETHGLTLQQVRDIMLFLASEIAVSEGVTVAKALNDLANTKANKDDVEASFSEKLNKDWSNAPIGLLSDFRNVLINPLGRQNQRQKTGTVMLAAGAYGHDRFKAGTAGCTYSFSINNGVTTFNITAGSLQQTIEAGHFAGRAGEYFLSWQGTAQGRVNGGGYGASGLVFATCDGSANVTVEWGMGTLSLPQFERGLVSDFSGLALQQELALCQRYFERFSPSEATGNIIHLGSGHIQNSVVFYVNFPMMPKRSLPTFSASLDVMGLAIAGADVLVSALSVSTPDKKQAFLTGSSSGLTPGQSCSLSIPPGAYIDFDAEL